MNVGRLQAHIAMRSSADITIVQAARCVSVLSRRRRGHREAKPGHSETFLCAWKLTNERNYLENNQLVISV